MINHVYTCHVDRINWNFLHWDQCSFVHKPNKVYNLFPLSKLSLTWNWLLFHCKITGILFLLWNIYTSGVWGKASVYQNPSKNHYPFIFPFHLLRKAHHSTWEMNLENETQSELKKLRKWLNITYIDHSCYSSDKNLLTHSGTA